MSHLDVAACVSTVRPCQLFSVALLMLMLQANPVTIPWQAEEVEAGEVAEDTSKDPRSAAHPALVSDFVMPMPLFPFLPKGEAPLSLSDVSPGKRCQPCSISAVHATCLYVTQGPHALPSAELSA